jgi:hypothetical protein
VISSSMSAQHSSNHLFMNGGSLPKNGIQRFHSMPSESSLEIIEPWSPSNSCRSSFLHRKSSHSSRLHFTRWIFPASIYRHHSRNCPRRFLPDDFTLDEVEISCQTKAYLVIIINIVTDRFREIFVPVLLFRSW